MLRLAVSVEGETERRFIYKTIAPYLRAKNIYATPIDMGGNVSIERAVSEINRLFYDFDAVTTLYDFYGFKKRNGRTIEEFLHDFKNAISQEHHRHFIPYIQKYEFETLLFSKPSAITDELNQPAQLHVLDDIVIRAGGAEKINDSKETSPSHRLKDIFPSFDKVLHAPIICEKIGIEEIKTACPRFAGWVTALENLG